jgi:hypothetical protein
VKKSLTLMLALICLLALLPARAEQEEDPTIF